MRLYSCSQARASFQSGEKVKQREGESHGGVDGGWRRGSHGDAKRFSIALLLKAVKPTCRAETNEAPALPHRLTFRSLLSLHTLDKADSLLPLIPAAVIVINVSHKCSAVTCSGRWIITCERRVRQHSANSHFAISARRVYVEVCVCVCESVRWGGVGRVSVSFPGRSRVAKFALYYRQSLT